jgi:hypothetical protein
VNLQKQQQHEKHQTLPEQQHLQVVIQHQQVQQTFSAHYLVLHQEHREHREQHQHLVMTVLEVSLTSMVDQQEHQEQQEHREHQEHQAVTEQELVYLVCLQDLAQQHHQKVVNLALMEQVDLAQQHQLIALQTSSLEEEQHQELVHSEHQEHRVMMQQQQH